MVVSHPLRAFLVLPGSHVVPVTAWGRLSGRCTRRVRWG